VKYLTGGKLGTMEEGFIARLKPGDCFFFAGRLLEFVRVRDMAAYVRKATKNKGTVPTWQGSKMALSTELGDAVLEMMQAAAQGDFFEPGAGSRAAHAADAAAAVEDPDAAHAAGRSLPVARRPAPVRLSLRRPQRAPRAGQPAGVAAGAREGQHLQHLDQRLRLRAGERRAFRRGAGHERRVFSGDDLLHDVLASLNSSELAQRRFREIARVAGLIFHRLPGPAKSARQLQASSALFYEVFRKYDAATCC
jgi:ATP-dependent Lhr-like helicase